MTTLCFAFFFFFPKPIVTKQPPQAAGCGAWESTGSRCGSGHLGDPRPGTVSRGPLPATRRHHCAERAPWVCEKLGPQASSRKPGHPSCPRGPGRQHPDLTAPHQAGRSGQAFRSGVNRILNFLFYSFALSQRRARLPVFSHRTVPRTRLEVLQSLSKSRLPILLRHPYLGSPVTADPWETGKLSEQMKHPQRSFVILKKVTEPR